MLLEEFQEWCREKDICLNCISEDSQEDFFNEFFKVTYCRGAMELSLTFSLLAKQIHDLQVCVEGIMEDIEEING